MEEHPAEDFVAIMVELPTCGDFKMCSRSMGVEAPGTLVLEDAEGTERFDLRAPEYDAVLEVALLPMFQDAIADASAWSCPRSGSESFITVTWRSGTAKHVRVVDGCVGSVDDTLRLYDVLMQRLVELKRKYLDCPPAFTVPADLDPENDPPPVRPLCFACLGQC
jgi:hypothetical protein